MQDTFERISKQITEKWNSMDKSEKLKISLTVFFSLIVLGIAVFIFNKATYVRLTNSDVKYEQIAQIQTVLDTNKISYVLEDNGNAIMVNQRDLGKAKIAISTENILGSEYSFGDMLKENMMGRTESEKNVIYTKVKEQELIEAIKQIDGIKDAVVKLTIPQDSPFVTDADKASKAAVQISLTKPLNERQVLGIAKFVSYSVDKLDISGVTITDTSSNALFDGSSMDESSGIGTVTRYDELKLSKENEVEKKVKELLAPMFGEVKVKANLKVNFDRYKETSEKVAPPIEGSKNGMIQTQQVQTSTSENGSSGQEPGYTPNSSTTTYNVGDTSTSKSGTEMTNTTYVMNKTVSELEKSTGEVLLDESSLSVIVYRTQVYDYLDIKNQGELKDTTWKDYVAKVTGELANKEEVINEDVIDLIQNATGVSQIAIKGFVKPMFIDEQPFEFPIQDYMPVIIMILFVVFIVWVLSRKPKASTVPHFEKELSVEQMLVSTRQKQPKRMDDLPEIEEHDSETKKRIEDFIEQKPELVAQLLKNWIAEDWE